MAASMFAAWCSLLRAAGLCDRSRKHLQKSNRQIKPWRHTVQIGPFVGRVQAIANEAQPFQHHGLGAKRIVGETCIRAKADGDRLERFAQFLVDLMSHGR